MADWDSKVEGNAVDWGFRDWVDPDQDAVADVMETFEEVTVREGVTATVTLLADGGAIEGETFEEAGPAKEWTLE